MILQGRKYIDALFDKVLDDLIFDDDDRDWVELNRDGLTQDLRCHKIITEAFHQRCSSLTTVGLVLLFDVSKNL